ncbi:hypothetical protein, partial [Pseudomonas lactis]|uniref:hypothetical protein n=1 Tax=Pseudomonas lactis TaxID=1615674 RepID=UPI002166082B
IADPANSFWMAEELSLRRILEAKLATGDEVCLGFFGTIRCSCIYKKSNRQEQPLSGKPG